MQLYRGGSNISCHRIAIQFAIVQRLVGFQAIQGELPLNKIKFEKLGYLEFDSNEKTKFTAREMKSAYVDSMAMLVKFLIYGSHSNKLNLFNQVSIIAVNCLGEHYIPPSGLKEPMAIGGRFEEEMQYDPSTIEKLKQLYNAKKTAILQGDYERAIKIKNAIERMKGIGIKLNELVDRKRQALDKQDYMTAKRLRDEIELLRNTVLNARLQFEDTSQLQPLQRQWSKNQVQRIVETSNHQVYDKISLTTEIIMRDAKNFMQPILDKEKVFTQEEINKIRAGGDFIEEPIRSNKLDRSFKRQVGNQQPLTIDELMQRRSMNQPIPKTGGQGQISGMGGQVLNVDDMVIPTHKGGNGGFNIPEYDPNEPNQYDNANNDDGEDQMNAKPEDLSEEEMKLAEPLIPVFGMELVKAIFASDWHKREQAINQIVTEISQGTKSQICGHIEQERLFTSCFGVIMNTVSDKIAQVCQASLQMIIKVCKEVFPTVTLNIKGELNRYVEKTCIWMLDKIGDNNSNVRKKTEEAALVMGGHPAIGPQVIIQHITKGQVKKSAVNSVKHIQGKLTLLQKTLQTYKYKQSWEACSEYAISHLQNSNGDVRTSAYSVLLELYLMVGKPLMSEFINLRPSQLDIINRAFAKADEGDVESAYEVIGSSNVISKATTGIKKSVDYSKSGQDENKSSRVSKSQSKKSQDLKSNYNMPKCNYCDLQNEDFDRDEIMDLHYWKDCRYLNECQYCQQVIEIPILKSHWLEECQKKGELRQCQRCKEVILENQFEQHTIELKCIPNPQSQEICPLCGVNISALIKSMGGKATIEDAWKNHINVDRCQKNVRKM
eukprot:403345233